MPGLHNVSNALAAVVVGHELDLDFSVVKQGLEGFAGIQRRLEIKGREGGIVVVDDYAHHPAEILATLDAARRGWDKKILVVFQPHRYTRTQLCFEEFLGAFHDADSVIVSDIYPAGEKELMGVHARRLAEGIRRQGHKEVHYMEGFPEIVSHLSEVCREGDMVLTLGAGDVYQVGEMLLKELKNRG
jgi:UDP-N-acetylmuramate--alanine ligase